MTTQLAAQPKCLYTKACSMNNKQEELEDTKPLENYKLLVLLKLFGMNPMTEGQLSRATGCSEGAGEERGVETLPSISGNG